MQRKDESEDDVIANFEERARDLHDALINYGVPARDIPQAIFDLRDLYRTVIVNDQKTFRPKRLPDPYNYENDESVVMARILGKFVHYSLNEKDIADLKPLTFAEADHIRDYLRFEEEVKEYARFVRDYMIKMNIEIASDKLVDADIGYFNRSGFHGNGIEKLQKLLRNIENANVPIDIIKRFKKVFDLIDSIDHTKHRMEKAARFYDSRYMELHSISFIPDKSQKENLHAVLAKVAMDL